MRSASGIWSNVFNRRGGECRQKAEPQRALSVLVQREMECGRSPLASIARASAGRVARPNATVTGTRKQRTETAIGFKRRSGWVTIGAPGAPDTEIVAVRPGGRLGLTAEAHTWSERPTGWEKKNLGPTCGGVFQRDKVPGHLGRFRCPSGGWLAGAAPVQLPDCA